jgi:hypothetical protein
LPISGEETKGGTAIALGIKGKAKAPKNCWIVAAEWEELISGEWIMKTVKTVKVDGSKIKENTWYSVTDGEFVEVTC